MTLRRIEPMKFPDIVPPADLGQRPELRWVDPRALLVDETYQRELGKDSRGLIRKVAANFAWARMKPPVVVIEGDGFHVVDGQHTAIAAASIAIAEIPVFIVGAGTVEEKANAFIGHNTDRIKVGSIQMHKSRLAAGDENARDIDNVCRRAGVRIRVMNQMSVIAEGDTGAIGTISAIIKRNGVLKARRIMEALVKGRRAPIIAHEILAAELIMCSRKPNCEVEELGAAIALDGNKGVMHAKASATLAGKLVRDVLADRWMRKMETIG